MTEENFLSELTAKPDSIGFDELMQLIDQYYYFTETAFQNGDLENAAGENSGSCKLFSFANSHGLSEPQTLACFGDYYREDVLQHPDADNHQNIRQFMRTGWQGIRFAGDALARRTD